MSACDCRWKCSAGIAAAATLLASRCRAAPMAACCTSKACTVPPGPTAAAKKAVSWPLPHVASTAVSPGRSTWPHRLCATVVSRPCAMICSNGESCCPSALLCPCTSERCCRAVAVAAAAAATAAGPCCRGNRCHASLRHAAPCTCRQTAAHKRGHRRRQVGSRRVQPRSDLRRTVMALRMRAAASIDADRRATAAGKVAALPSSHWSLSHRLATMPDNCKGTGNAAVHAQVENATACCKAPPCHAGMTVASSWSSPPLPAISRDTAWAVRILQLSGCTVNTASCGGRGQGGRALLPPQPFLQPHPPGRRRQRRARPMHAPVAQPASPHHPQLHNAPVPAAAQDVVIDAHLRKGGEAGSRQGWCGGTCTGRLARQPQPTQPSPSRGSRQALQHPPSGRAPPAP